MLLLDHRQRGGTVGRLDDLVALQAEGPGQRLPDRPVVVGEEDSSAGHRGFILVAQRSCRSAQVDLGPVRRDGAGVAPRRTGLDREPSAGGGRRGRTGGGGRGVGRRGDRLARTTAGAAVATRAIGTVGQTAGEAVVHHLGDAGGRLGELGVGLCLGDRTVGDRWSSSALVAATIASITSWAVLPLDSASALSVVPSRSAVRTSSALMPRTVATVSTSMRAMPPRRPGPPWSPKPLTGSAVASLATIASSCAAVIVPSSTSGWRRARTRCSRSAAGFGASVSPDVPVSPVEPLGSEVGVVGSVTTAGAALDAPTDRRTPRRSGRRRRRRPGRRQGWHRR